MAPRTTAYKGGKSPMQVIFSLGRRECLRLPTQFSRRCFSENSRASISLRPLPSNHAAGMRGFGAGRPLKRCAMRGSLQFMAKPLDVIGNNKAAFGQANLYPIAAVDLIEFRMLGEHLFRCGGHHLTNRAPTTTDVGRTQQKPDEIALAVGKFAHQVPQIECGGKRRSRFCYKDLEGTPSISSTLILVRYNPLRIGRTKCA